MADIEQSHAPEYIELFSYKWALPAIEALRTGPKYFIEIESHWRLENAPANTLSTRLQCLRSRGLIRRSGESNAPKHARYSLTDDGKRVVSLVDQITRLGRSGLEQAPTGYLYWQYAMLPSNQDETPGIRDVLRYKWSRSILCVLSGELLHFNEIKRRLDLPASTVAARLQEFEREEFIFRRIGEGNPPRVYYSLTSKGRWLRPLLQDLEELVEASVDDTASRS